MFGNSHFASVHQLFADQFEPDETGFLYRKSMRGAAIRISETERDAFIFDFQNRMRYVSWTILLATLLLIGFLAWLGPETNSPIATAALYGGLAMILVPSWLALHLIWNAPARSLQRRAVVGQPRTKEEIRQVMFARMTYGELASAAFVGVFFIWNSLSKDDAFRGWGLAGLIFGGGLMIGAATQAFRKWMRGRR